MIGKQFTDLDGYNKQMAKDIVMNDKLFFLDEIEEEKFSVIVDFGCADGILLTKLYERNKAKMYIGYDISEEMISLAKSKFEYQDAGNVLFTSNWKEVETILAKNMITLNSGKSCLVLSSVIHEVYSYAKSDDDIKEFWHRTIESSLFDYIVIRDMMPSEDIIRRLSAKDMHIIRNKINTASCSSDLMKYHDMLTEFEKIWGYISDNKNLVHFLLKYKWVINWNREVHENYFPFFIEEMNERIRKSNFNIMYFKRFCPLKSDVKKTFDIDMIDNTHVKYILKFKNGLFKIS